MDIIRRFRCYGRVKDVGRASAAYSGRHRVQEEADVPNSDAGTVEIEQSVQKQARRSWHRLAQGFADSFKSFARKVTKDGPGSEHSEAVPVPEIVIHPPSGLVAIRNDSVLSE